MKEKRNRRSPRNNIRVKATTVDIIILAVLFGLFTLKLNLVFSLILFGGIFLIIYINDKYKDKLMTDKKLKRKSLLRMLVFGGLGISVIALLGVVVLSILVIINAPEFNEELLIKKESSVVYDKDDNIITELGVQKRDNKEYEEMSETLLDAVIATEDARFFQHNGLDGVRFIKAALGNLTGNRDAGGASTISMQIVKNTYTDTDTVKKEGIKKYLRKFTDIYLSVFKLEKKYTKKEILVMYLNSHFLGANSNGVEQAAKTYFNKSSSHLNLAEASMIAGLFQAPGAYNPYRNIEYATQRRNTVLNLMVRHGYISPLERDIVREIPLDRIVVAQKTQDRYQAYIDTVIEELKELGYNPYIDSINIYTNMDRAKQDALDNIFSGKTYKWKDEELHAGMAAINIHTGQVEAIGSGRDGNVQRGFNYATQINRQIGSTAKPLFDYGPGIEFENWSTYTQWNDKPHKYSTGKTVQNSDGKYNGWITSRYALMTSRNTAALQAFQANKNSNILKFVRGLGIEPEVENGRIHEAHALGAYNSKTSNPRDLAAAYAAFGNGGTYYKPYTVRKIVNRTTNDKKEFQPMGKKAMSDSTAYMITDMLLSTSQSGFSKYFVPANQQSTVAAKTGTTNFPPEVHKAHGIPNAGVGDFWLAAFDNQTALSIWMGYQKVSSKSYIHMTNDFGRRNDLFATAIKGVLKSNTTFKMPDSVVKVPILKGSNPPIKASSGGIYELFKKGTEPTMDETAIEKLPNVENLNYDYNESTQTLTLSWSKINAPEDAQTNFGKFGYKVFKDGVPVPNTFTENNQYIFKNVSNPTGVYKVITSYEAFSGNASSGSTLIIEDNATYDIILKDEESVYTKGTKWLPRDINPSKSDLIVTRNGEVITNFVVDRTKLVDENDVETKVQDAFNKIGKYELTYFVSHGKNSIGQVTRLITVN